MNPKRYAVRVVQELARGGLRYPDGTHTWPENQLRYLLNNRANGENGKGDPFKKHLAGDEGFIVGAAELLQEGHVYTGLDFGDYLGIPFLGLAVGAAVGHPVEGAVAAPILLGIYDLATDLIRNRDLRQLARTSVEQYQKNLAEAGK
ncbi:MAG: hypothetical protein V1820_00805 [archaeon]